MHTPKNVSYSRSSNLMITEIILISLGFFLGVLYSNFISEHDPYLSAKYIETKKLQESYQRQYYQILREYRIFKLNNNPEDKLKHLSDMLSDAYRRLDAANSLISYLQAHINKKVPNK